MVMNRPTSDGVVGHDTISGVVSSPASLRPNCRSGCARRRRAGPAGPQSRYSLMLPEDADAVYDSGVGSLCQDVYRSSLLQLHVHLELAIKQRETSQGNGDSR
jgi:hypothetical protein